MLCFQPPASCAALTAAGCKAALVHSACKLRVQGGDCACMVYIMAYCILAQQATCCSRAHSAAELRLFHWRASQGACIDFDHCQITRRMPG